MDAAVCCRLLACSSVRWLRSALPEAICAVPVAMLRAERVFDDRRAAALQRALPRLRAPQLRAALLAAARIDRMIKGLVQGDVWDEFLQLALRLARKPT